MQNRILIIDDDKTFVESTSAMLTRVGFSVMKAYSGQEGYTKAKDDAPDLIVLDIMMSHKEEGKELAQAFEADAAIREIPVIVVTSLEKEELEKMKPQLPADKVIRKPLEAESFLKVIDEYMSKAGKVRHDLVNLVEKFCAKWKGKDGNLIMILHQIQNHYGYVPREVSFELSRILDVPLARIYEVITFYNYFKIDPPGKHLISICMGTACYLKGTADILQELESILKIKEGQTTKDGKFHLQLVRCVGCCGLAPVMLVDDKVYGKIKKEDVMGIITEYSA